MSPAPDKALALAIGAFVCGVAAGGWLVRGATRREMAANEAACIEMLRRAQATETVCAETMRRIQEREDVCAETLVRAQTALDAQQAANAGLMASIEYSIGVDRAHDEKARKRKNVAAAALD